ncbi:hypothetical protein BCR37DRAFT_391808 [Protomyces lactucae-debilis]|uniref:Tetratricopeptide SHNi-TPR domain-containing protein n=1 Tax=Protomyces lactucae-debilis TaxID=2754530 RepID=A0A1Y2FJQ6_PROLT|nr:uncharacterized protein BCR37DRAFT_391808 [Protomyces lactucae-debilis]ORY84202.1 hypothetical protein BCR37DRAFT_391808 [Protomyces lactucae-debilis]
MEAVNAFVAQANKLYALKNFADAADKYADAAEEVAKVNGEDDPRNADILFLYGRCLFKLAIERSQVLGGGGTDDKQPGQPAVGATPNAAPKGPMFSFDGDEPEDEAEENPQEEGAQEDEFQNAWEVLDAVRIMYEKQQAGSSAEDEKDIKRKLGDTFELLGEIGLENGKSPTSLDLTAALTNKQAVFSAHSRECSSAHYMLALAQEYAPGDGNRAEAAKQLRLAIEGFEARLAEEGDESKKKDEKEMLDELQVKLAELEAPPERIMKEDIAKLFNTDESSLKESLVAAMQTSTDLSTLQS